VRREEKRSEKRREEKRREKKREEKRREKRREEKRREEKRREEKRKRKKEVRRLTGKGLAVRWVVRSGFGGVGSSLGGGRQLFRAVVRLWFVVVREARREEK
jgi:hypothetical protein